MKVLVVGSGGREHALAWKLAQEAEVIAWPGNPGIAECARVPPCSSAPGAIVALAKNEQVDLVVIGPEDPLIGGLADEVRSAGIPCFGPGAAGARLEGSKAFAKELMRESGVPTAPFAIFSEAGDAKRYADKGNVVVKASGAALGKGVVVCNSASEAYDAIDSMLVDRVFGEAGSTIVIEDRLCGPELSLLTLCSDEGFLTLPVAQDHKRALDNDRGPNTGGMGSVSPVPSIQAAVIRQAEDEIVRPTLDALRAKGISFRGVLFTGIMIHENRPYCLEFNVRFGDPETQSVVRRLGSGFLDALYACANGWHIPGVEVLENAAVTVVVASGGYPGPYEKGKPITIGELPPRVQVFHAGTSLRDEQLVSNGGRVLAVSAEADSVEAARTLAYAGVDAVSFEGRQYRTDIAKPKVLGF